MRQKVYSRKWISILLAAVIVLGMFNAQRMTAGAFVLQSESAQMSLECASHKLLTAAMPEQERQSVRESFADWQNSFFVRVNRPSEPRNAQRNELQHTVFLVVLSAISFYIANMACRHTEDSCLGCQTIVGYIHKQDGEKD